MKQLLGNEILGADGRPARLSYDATESTGRRRVRTTRLRSEDSELSILNRNRLVSNTRDLTRNYSIAAWAVRRHLDYVSTFSFQCRSGDDEIDRRIESLMSWWSRPQNCDVTGRHSLAKIIRLLEGRRTVDGDSFLFTLDDGRIQAIEGDRVRNPTHRSDGKLFKAEGYVHGVRVGRNGRALAYVVCDRGNYSNQFTCAAEIPSQYVIHHGCFDRFDQIRGVSPLASALNTFSDVYECAEYALAKAKVSQLFGLKLTRTGDAALPVDTDNDGDAVEPYSFDFGKEPQVLDLDYGDDAEFLESRTPSSEFAEYCDRMIGAALKSLDIPYSFYDESFTNYSGARQALLQYEQSAACKRTDVQQVLDRLTAWRLGLFIEDGYLSLPNGMRLSDFRWEWIPVGLPWIDPLKEIKADALAISSGISSRQRVARARGMDWMQIADELTQEKRIMREKGLSSDSAEIDGDENDIEDHN